MRKVVCLWIGFGIALCAAAQTSVLERKISLTLENVRMDVALQEIAQTAKVTFSYSPDVIGSVDRTMSFQFVEQSVRHALDVIFEGRVQYKVRGNYVILTRAAEESTRKREIVTGYVVDESTGQRLRNVSVYDPITLASTVTDSFGYFELSLNKQPGDIILSVNRENYRDTVVRVAPRSGLLNIPIGEKLEAIADDLTGRFKRSRKVQKVHRLNIQDTIYRAMQLSFVPYVGTNHKLSAHVVNDYSVNVLAGYSAGVGAVEFGGIANAVRGDMKGVQFAGLANTIGGGVDGVQFAGLVNTVRGNVSGAQFSGLVNAVKEGTDGVQFAGLLNANAGTADGAYFAGLLNLNASNADGVFMAGVGNVTLVNQKGPAIGGVFNFAGGKVRLGQVAGVVNIAGDSLEGFQLAGVMNLARRQVKGAQIAGVLNVARAVDGSQIGLLNFADTLKGTPVGLLSFVRKGYHKLELSADEIFYNNIAFRTGTHTFYNILLAGAVPSTYGLDGTTWTFGYGLGTAPRLSRKLYLNVDLTSQQIVEGKIDALNLLNRLHASVDWQAGKKISIVIGPALNVHLLKQTNDTYPSLFRDLQPHVFYDKAAGSEHRMRMWVGGKVGVRFF